MAFLNGKLDEEIYIDQPQGFVAKGQKRKVCKLKRSIYGLKNPLNNGISDFTRPLFKMGFR